jgi:3-hydroxyacyl-CoA dehydrogenase
MLLSKAEVARLCENTRTEKLENSLQLKLKWNLLKIQPSDSDTDLANCDLIIEAVLKTKA